MAKIIYKKGMKGQNNLSSIEGIEIDLINGQKALIYPKYAKRQMLTLEQISKWGTAPEADIEALKVTDTTLATQQLFALDSPAALWVAQFHDPDKCRIFCLPSLLAALEIQHQKKEIDALAETVEGADLLKDYTACILSCSRHSLKNCKAVGGRGNKYDISLNGTCLVVPTILYR